MIGRGIRAALEGGRLSNALVALALVLFWTALVVVSLS